MQSINFNCIQFKVQINQWSFQKVNILQLKFMRQSSKFRSPVKRQQKQKNISKTQNISLIQLPRSSQYSPLFKDEKQPSPKIPYFKNESYNVEAYDKHRKSIHNKSTQPSNERLYKISNILGNITAKHQQMKNKIERMKRQKQNFEEQEIMQLSFEPKFNHNPKYQIKSGIQERNKSWSAAKIKNYTSIRKEIAQNQVKQCTFAPSLIAKPKSIQILKDKESRIQKIKDKQKERDMDFEDKFLKVKNRELNIESNPKKPKYNMDYHAIKSMIKYEMGKINFNF